MNEVKFFTDRREVELALRGTALFGWLDIRGDHLIRHNKWRPIFFQIIASMFVVVFFGSREKSSPPK
jgi:hypothetical protein